MRYRALDPSGDMQFGSGRAAYLQDSPEAVAQAVRTRLALFLGEWFLDTSDGTAWATRVLGKGTQPTRELEVRDRVAGTPGVRAIISLSGKVNPDTRLFTVACRVDTVYGLMDVQVPFSGPGPTVRPVVDPDAVQFGDGSVVEYSAAPMEFD